MAETSYEALKLDHQLCFRLYSAARRVTRLYHPFLDPLGITYPQYLALLVLWEAQEPLSVGELGQRLELESNTLTPMLKKLEVAGFVERRRSAQDERVQLVSLTDAGWALRESAAHVPECLYEALGVSDEVAIALVGALDAFSGEMRSGNAGDARQERA
ncbi:MAG: MarR family transcriptional regulator [Eggerthellaceae bacterium]|nr:MarR family transcriptional regulator [Eggerthellaceae bacterium]